MSIDIVDCPCTALTLSDMHVCTSISSVNNKEYIFNIRRLYYFHIIQNERQSDHEGKTNDDLQREMICKIITDNNVCVAAPSLLLLHS